MKKKLAIVGSGISATSCAYYLRDEFDITIFDKNDYLGGHTHTHKITENNITFTIDTGFIVFNLATYPNLLKFFSDLGVEKRKSTMSFSVWNKITNLQFSGSGLTYLFAQSKNIFSPRYWKFLKEINTFFKVANRDLKTIANNKQTVREYCASNGLSDFFIENYLVPMSSAVWSVQHSATFDLPIALLLPFYQNHGLLGVGKQLDWYTVKNGSNVYIEKVYKNGAYAVHLNEEVQSVEEASNNILLVTDKKTYEFDYVVLACHSDESLVLAKGLPTEKKALLGSFSYQPNTAVLHTDESVMPPIKKVWSSWNYVMNKTPMGTTTSSTVYWVNSLQDIPVPKNYFVSINPAQQIDKTKILMELPYRHPHYTVENFFEQKRLQSLNGNTRIFFAGAYFGHGFHEDGIKSGLAVVENLKKLA